MQLRDAVDPVLDVPRVPLRVLDAPDHLLLRGRLLARLPDQEVQHSRVGLLGARLVEHQQSEAVLLVIRARHLQSIGALLRTTLKSIRQ